MHYRNGREAHNGDKVVNFHPTGTVVVGVLTNATAGNDYCNGYLWPVSTWVNLRDCLHYDDFVALWPPDHLEPKS